VEQQSGMIATGYLLALLMGTVLGLTGAGGAILTVPILVYFFKIKPEIATGYSLFIVGVISSITTVHYWKNKQSDLLVAFLFASPSMVSMLLTRALILPSIPDVILTNEHFVLHKDIVIMLLFAALMIAAGVFMLIPRPQMDVESVKTKMTSKKLIVLLLMSLFLGFVAGLVGAGGGFMIIPLLSLFFKFPLKIAIGTSLAIVSINSLIGFSGDLMRGISLDWLILIPFLFLSLFGIFLGTFVAKKIHPKHIRQLFGVFVILMGLTIMINESLF
jgi:uncharacterized membrane protein YfcA